MENHLSVLDTTMVEMRIDNKEKDLVQDAAPYLDRIEPNERRLTRCSFYIGRHIPRLNGKLKPSYYVLREVLDGGSSPYETNAGPRSEDLPAIP
jgi:hypothetical protein